MWLPEDILWVLLNGGTYDRGISVGRFQKCVVYYGCQPQIVFGTWMPCNISWACSIGNYKIYARPISLPPVFRQLRQNYGINFTPRVHGSQGHVEPCKHVVQYIVSLTLLPVMCSDYLCMMSRLRSAVLTLLELFAPDPGTKGLSFTMPTSPRFAPPTLRCGGISSWLAAHRRGQLPLFILNSNW